jgi:hypothetical protein
MSGDHAKKEMKTGEKPTTSHGNTSSEESRTKRKEKKKDSSKGKEKGSSSHHKEKKEKSSSHKPHKWGQEKEDEKGGLLRDRLFIGIHLRLRRGVRHF